MPDSSTEMAGIAEEMDELLRQAGEVGLQPTLYRLREAAIEVGISASGSWIGYQANVYYRYFEKPTKDAFFNSRFGLSIQPSYLPFPRTTGDWREYDWDEVIRIIKKRAGNPDTEPTLGFRQKASEQILWRRKDLLSILDIESNESPSQFLNELKKEADELSLPTEQETLWSWAPQEPTTDDKRAMQEGLRAPPHLAVLARVEATQNTVATIVALRDIARQAESHIGRRKYRRHHSNSKNTRVFIGHGHSPIWWELKNFLENQLGLATDEFNNVSTAGVSTTDRLMATLDSAMIAFLVMTGEDEQPSGAVRPRENVVHEAGLFQGHLGFKRAIVLLEDGCEKFSNNAGLGHINFPKGNIRAAFQDIREVLEREGLVDKGAA